MNEITISAIARKDADGAVAVADPFEAAVYHTNAEGIIRSMFARKDAHAAAFAALGDIAEAPLDAVKELYRAVKDDDDALNDHRGNMMDALLDFSGFKAVIVQMQGTKVRIDPLSVRGKFAEWMKALKARIDAEKPAEPKHTYIFQFEATDADLKKIVKQIDGASAGRFRWCAPQSDKAWKQMDKWFAENI